MGLVVIVLLIIIFILTLHLFRYRRDISFIVDELKYIEDKKLYNRNLVNYSNNKGIEELLKEINLILKRNISLKVEYDRREGEIKDMIANISHDLRTPLTSIKGYAELLYEGLDAEEAKRALEIIRSRSESLEKLINSFYQLSRLENQDIKNKLEYLDLAEILRQLIADYYQSFMNKGMTPRIEISNEEILVIADKAAVERVFSNLIDNAIKYASNDFHIVLKKDGDKIINSFSNSVGELSNEELDRFFDKFYTMDSSRQGDSTGLGLYISRKLMESMGFKIFVVLESSSISFKLDWNKELAF